MLSAYCHAVSQRSWSQSWVLLHTIGSLTNKIKGRGMRWELVIKYDNAVQVSVAFLLQKHNHLKI